MIKNFLVILFFLLINLFVKAQNFEGKVLYRNTFVSKLPNISEEKFKKLIGSEQLYVIKLNCDK